MLQVSLSREQELEKRFALKAACLSNAQQHQVILGHWCTKNHGDVSLFRNVSNRSFSRIIVPRDGIVVEKREQTVSIPYEPFLIFQSQVGSVVLIHNSLWFGVQFDWTPHWV
jgi:hypothetical protein